jgi:uncharacterized protein (DUF3084 family)
LTNLNEFLNQFAFKIHTETEGTPTTSSQISAQQMAQMDKLQTDLTNQATITDQINKNIETLQADVRQLVGSNQQTTRKGKINFDWFKFQNIKY